MSSILPRVGGVLLIAALTAGCGLKNDLYLPEPGTTAASTGDTGPESSQSDEDETDS